MSFNVHFPHSRIDRFSWKIKNLYWQTGWKISPGYSWHRDMIPRKMGHQRTSELLLNFQPGNRRWKSKRFWRSVKDQKKRFYRKKSKHVVLIKSWRNSFSFFSPNINILKGMNFIKNIPSSWIFCRSL